MNTVTITASTNDQYQRDQKAQWRIARRMSGYVTALERRRRVLSNIVIIYRDQPAILPVQTTATLGILSEARRVMLAALAFLQNLHPAETERIRPYGCMTKLEALDDLCTQIILNVAMFAQVCQSVDPARTRLHLEIRAALPVLLCCYDDTAAMLAALVERQVQI
ncbi:MAG: hypothetical protein ACRDHW_20480 [Ktedonobacteraceae bacterium]